MKQERYTLVCPVCGYERNVEPHAVMLAVVPTHCNKVMQRKWSTTVASLKDRDTPAGHNGNVADDTFQESKFHTESHRVVINKGGVVLRKSSYMPDEASIYIEPKDAIAQAEYLLAHKKQLEQLQKDLDETWNAVAQEVMAYMEEHKPGSFAEASQFDIWDTLEVLSESRTIYAGSWYRSLYDKNGVSLTFEQQWRPFLRSCERLREQIQDEEGAETDLYHMARS